MRHAASLLACILCIVLGCSLSEAHPGGAIAVDRQGTVFFMDTLKGVWKIDRAGKLTFVGQPNFHWFALDEDNRFARFSRHTSQDEMRVVAGASSPTLVASSDFPVAMQGGALYFAPTARGKPLPVVRVAPDGSSKTLATLPGFEWVNGLTAGQDGSIYGTVDKGIFRVAPSGNVTWISRNVTLPECQRMAELEDEPAMPYLRGLAVDAEGAIFVAATGCRSVVRISPSGKVNGILKAEAPWSPTAVATADGAIYVLEYDHSAAERVWPPRVRKFDASGKVTELARVTR
jgi:sugar lactone lactonase YvrE